jgi:hypothetical protein
MFLATKLSASHRGHEQCRAEATARCQVHSQFRVTECTFTVVLSPEDNDSPEVGWFATSLRRIGLAMFHDERNAALLDNQVISNQQVSQHIQPNPSWRNVGKAMLVPFMIFLMILSPVLIPTAVTIVNVMQGKHRPVGTARRPRSLASRRFAAA